LSIATTRKLHGRRAVLLVVAIDVVQASNGQAALEPMLRQDRRLAEELGRGRNLLAIPAISQRRECWRPAKRQAIDPLSPWADSPHHPPLAERFADPPSRAEKPNAGLRPWLIG